MQGQNLSTFGDYVAIARRRKGILLICCPLILLLAFLLAYKLPAVYRSSGTIMLEASSVPEELVRSTVASYADEQIELVRRRVMTTDRLELVVEEFDPYPDQPELSNRDKARLITQNTDIERVDPITLEPLLESTAFSIHYVNGSPDRASEIATRILNLFLDDSRERRTQSASGTVQFLEEQARQYEIEITEAEELLAAFKRRNSGALPESQGANQALLESTRQDMVDYDRRIREVDQQISLMRLQLSQTPPSLISAAGNYQLELADLRAALQDARRRYTPEHPDIRRLERQIATLQEQASDRGNVTVQPDNPTYLELEAQIRAAQQEVTALRIERENLRAQIDEYTRRLALAPEIEREYLGLMRASELAQGNYREIQVKLSEAEQAVSLESQQRGERFTLIREPFPRSTPFSPNRLGIIMLGFVLAFGGAIGLAAIVEASDSTIRGAKDLREVLGTPPLGAVPSIQNRKDRRHQKMRWAAAMGAFAAVALIGISI